MSVKTLISPIEVIEYAFVAGEYIGEGVITEPFIAAAQQRYIEPIIGKRLLGAIVGGKYEDLRVDYIAPTLAILARVMADLEAYPPTEAQRERGKIFLTTLSDYLNANSDDFEEYSPEENVKNRLSLSCGFALEQRAPHRPKRGYEQERE